MDNEILIPSNKAGEYNKGFAPIKLQISFDKKNTDINYYLHKCDRIEYQEVKATEKTEEELKQLSLETPETIYFYNNSNTSQVFQSDSKRTDQATEDEALNGEKGTLYFINEEES